MSRELALLSELAPGSVAEVVSIEVSAWQERLRAYGLAPGRRLRLVQQVPVTVVCVDHVDLAFEAGIAGGVLVALCGASETSGPGSAGAR